MNYLTKEQLDFFIDQQQKLIEPTSEEYRRLERLKDILYKRQFQDVLPGLSEQQFNSWIKKQGETFIATIPTKSLLMGSSHNYQNHSYEELSTPLFGGLSIKQIVDILDSLELETIMKIICDDVYVNNPKARCFKWRSNPLQMRTPGRIELLGTNQTVDRGTTHPNKIVVGYHSFNLRTTIQEVKSINGINANEFFFKTLKLPIATVLGSINAVNTQYPSILPEDEDLCHSIELAQSPAKKLVLIPDKIKGKPN